MVVYKADPHLYSAQTLIGMGATALVFKGQYNDEGKKYPIAIKAINLDKATSNIQQL